MKQLVRINIGCGQSPTAGWRNFDNSPSLTLAKIPILPGLLRAIGFYGQKQQDFVNFAKKNAIEYGNASKGLPIQSGTVDVIYTSHMLEHLDREEAAMFLKESLRLLRPGGTLRIAVPDIAKYVDQYNRSGDADELMQRTRVCVPRPRTMRQKLRLLVSGTRHHQWMYDGKSLVRLLEEHGFVDAVSLPIGETRIPDPSPLNLAERSDESVYVEARKPSS